MSESSPKIVLLIISFMLVWAGAGMIFKYKKYWIGNSQEMYPTLILPGFVRNKEKIQKGIYQKYLIVATNEKQDTFLLYPQDVFGRHWLFKMSAVINQKELKSENRNINWISNLPEDVISLRMIKQIRVFKDNEDQSHHQIKYEESRTIYVR